MAQVMKQPLKRYTVPNFSIFSPEPLDKSDEFEEEEKVDYSERSPSPLEEVIRVPPIKYEDFLKILRDRVKPDPNFNKLTVEHQEGLVSILFCEVHTHWDELCENITDPALDTQQNRKVHVMLFIEVVRICQHLFTSYLNKVDKLNAKGVFSNKANISRIKGALISESNISLNIHRLRQKILLRFRTKHSSTLSSKISSKPTTAIPASEFAGFFDKELAKKLCHPVTPMKPVVLGDRSKPTSMPHLVASLMDLVKQPPPQPKKKMTLPQVVEELMIATHEEQDAPVGSVEFRHKDLEFLMSDHRQPLTAAIDDEEELSALLQATTKCTIVKRPPPTSRLSVSEMSDTIDTSDRPIQPAVTSYDMPDKTIVRTSDIRVSERVPLSDMILELSPCIYNELNNDITESDITFLDRNLFLGQEIREVYSEIYKTISHDHLKFTSTMEAPCTTLPTQSCYNSGVLQRTKYKHKRLNEKLKIVETAPWSDGLRAEWEGPVHFQGDHSQNNSEVFPSQIIKFPQFSDFDTSNNFGPSGKDPQRQLSKEGRSYTNWLQWWKSIMSAEDYQRYTSIRDSDYLALIFHLYDSEEDVDSADERDALLESEMKKEKERRNQKLEKMMEAKNKYEGGFWNANSILMGGLGKHPDIDDQEGAVLSLEQSTSRPIPKIEMKLSRGISASSSRKSVGSKKTKKSSTLLENPEDEEPPQIVEVRILQDRLENIWDSLEMPDDKKIDMTVKYCNLDVKKLKKVVDLWDAACSSVISREKLILELETFEKSASDPKRFFTFNTPMTRIKEEKQRSGLHRRIKKCDKEVKTNLLNVRKALKDTVTYQGRDYLEKMSRDLTEMLYWLQQERRQYALEKGGMVMVDLPPISPVDLI